MDIDVTKVQAVGDSVWMAALRIIIDKYTLLSFAFIIITCYVVLCNNKSFPIKDDEIHGMNSVYRQVLTGMVGVIICKVGFYIVSVAGSLLIDRNATTEYFYLISQYGFVVPTILAVVDIIAIIIAKSYTLPAKKAGKILTYLVAPGLIHWIVASLIRVFILGDPFNFFSLLMGLFYSLLIGIIAFMSYVVQGIICPLSFNIIYEIERLMKLQEAEIKERKELERLNSEGMPNDLRKLENSVNVRNRNKH